GLIIIDGWKGAEMGNQSIQALPPALQHKLAQTAADYTVYKAFKDANKPGDPLMLQTLQRVYSKELLAFFAKIDGQPQLVQLMKALHVAKFESAEQKYIAPPTPNALKQSRGDTLLKGMQNLTSGALGNFGQAFGQSLSPNAPQKATAVGDIF